MKKIILYSLSILLLFFVVSCSEQRVEKVEKPANCIEEDKFVDLLVDIQIADAILIDRNLNDNRLADTTVSYYNSIFNKHEINEAHFNETLKYYASYPEKMQELNNKVSEILKAKKKELEK